MRTLMRETRLRLGIPLVLVAVMWVVEGANIATHDALEPLGIWPRSARGLWGILFAPFLHANLAHLIANTLPFLILGWLVALRGLRQFVQVTLVVMVLGGLGVWLIGRPISVHVGASGLIFGYLGYILARGLFERSVQAVLVSIVAIVLYGGAIWGILPSSPRISWESHLCGFLAGVAAARLLPQRRRVKQLR